MTIQKEYAIVTDSTCDLPFSFYRENQIPIFSIPFTFDGTSYTHTNIEVDLKDFYNRIRDGGMPKTAQAGREGMESTFEGYLSRGIEVLYIGFSSALSGTFGTGMVTLQDISAKYPGVKAIAIDSLCASLGEGLLVSRAVELKKQGKTIDEVAQWVMDNRLKICHFFTVDDLNHLFRGGRVSKTSALLGSMLGIKPVLHVNDEGKLIPLSKVRGRKQSLDALVDYMKQTCDIPANDTIFISHADCEEDAKYVADKIKAALGFKRFLINTMGPTIGSHTGVGAIALFFLGKERYKSKA